MQTVAVEATGLPMQFRTNSTPVPADRTATSALAQAATARKLASMPKLAATVMLPKLPTVSLVITAANTLAEMMREFDLSIWVLLSIL